MIEMSISRRGVLGAMGSCVASAVLPGSAFCQSPMHVKILVPSAAPLLMWSSTFLGEALGFFRDEGVTFELFPTAGGPAAMTALIARGGDMAFTGPADSIPAVTRGQRIKALMALSNYNPVHFVISKDYAAKHGVSPEMSLATKLVTAKKFKGLRCGVTAPGSVVDLSARLLLRQIGLRPGADAQIVPMGNPANSMAAMSRGAVDAFVSTSPIPETAVARFGAIAMFSAAKDEIRGLKSAVGQLIQVRAPDIEKSAEKYAGFIRASVRAFRFLRENTAQAGEIIYKSRFSSTVPAEIWSAVWNENVAMFRTPYISRESVAAWPALGLIPGVQTFGGVDEFIEMRFVNESAKQIGWPLDVT